MHQSGHFAGSQRAGVSCQDRGNQPHRCMEHSICPGVRGRRWAEACELSDRDHLEWRSMTYAVHHEKTFPWSLEEAMETEPLNLREAQGTHLPRPNPTSSSSNRTRTGTKTRAGLLAQALHRPDLREPVKIHTNLKKTF
jgi:hypothetical protein